MEEGINRERRTVRKKEFRWGESPGFKQVGSVLLAFLSVKQEGLGGGTGFTFLPS